MEAPLHESWVQQPRAIINRVHMLLHGCMLLALLYYRATTTFSGSGVGVLLARFAVFLSEALLSFLWVLCQPFRWRPIARAVFPERLPADEKLPNIDVFVCTADPEMEPAVEVMNTVIAAMALDYPVEKLAVYLSDDGGSDATLHALREAASFAVEWLPYCKKHGIITRSPEAYFSVQKPDLPNHSSESGEDRQRMELLYLNFKKRVKKFQGYRKSLKDRPALIEVIHDRATEATANDKAGMPMLVYVSREKKHNIPHHFKAGALNVLLRVSSVLSNAPYILGLDCDMCSNDPSSARQAMCFHLDPSLSPTLAFVQFPQVFGNLGSRDIYGGGLKWLFERLWIGLDGLLGPFLSGTNFYIKRSALNGARPETKANPDITQLIETFGSSNLFLATLRQDINRVTTKDSLIKEAHILASCTYEDDTKWGKEAGFLYDSVVEDYFTGFNLHCRGWKSVYCRSSRPAFLGSAPINLRDTLVQNKRWSSGLLQVGLSRFCPLTWGISKTSITQSMCYAWLAFTPLEFVTLCFALVSPLCLLTGVSVYPKVSSPWLLVYLGTYLSYVGQHLWDVLVSGGSFQQWWIEERIWMMTAVSSSLFGFLNVILKLVGITQVDFELTNKATDEDQIERYTKGIFDFQGTSFLMIPIITVATINVECFVGGVRRMIREGSYDLMLGQVMISSLILICSLPLFEGILVRKDTGRVPSSLSLISMILSVIALFGIYSIHVIHNW